MKKEKISSVGLLLVSCFVCLTFLTGCPWDDDDDEDEAARMNNVCAEALQLV